MKLTSSTKKTTKKIAEPWSEKHEAKPRKQNTIFFKKKNAELVKNERSELRGN